MNNFNKNICYLLSMCKYWCDHGGLMPSKVCQQDRFIESCFHFIWFTLEKLWYIDTSNWCG